jgi:PadR family transcriptional regulator PadR
MELRDQLLEIVAVAHGPILPPTFCRVPPSKVLYIAVLHIGVQSMSVRRPLEEAKKGSAELVILAIVEDESHHGYEIAKLIEARTGGSLRFTLASLYATLYRLEERGWIKGRWVEKTGQRRRCHYRITEAGRRVLAEQRADWSRFVAALAQVAGVKFA